jgi:hypothetical protein
MPFAAFGLESQSGLPRGNLEEQNQIGEQCSGEEN